MGSSSRVLEVLIPARFVLTMGHLVAMLMIASSKRDNIYAGLPTDPSQSRFDAAKFQFEVAYVLSILCFGLDLVGIFFGTSIFFVKTNLLHIICHFAGGVLVALMIEQSWQFQYLWLALFLTNLPTALVELATLVAIFGLNVVIF